MSWREKLHTSTPRLEIDVLLGLEERGLTQRCGGMFRNVQICLESTEPDYLWPLPKFPVYLDGPPHEGERQRLKDELIDEKLRRRGYSPLRIPYKRYPVSDRQLNEILDQIEEMLDLLEERIWR